MPELHVLMRTLQKTVMATCIKTNLSPSYAYKKGCRCETCCEWKRIAEFPRREQAREASRLWRLQNLERSRQNSKNYQKNNPRKLLQFQF